MHKTLSNTEVQTVAALQLCISNLDMGIEVLKHLLSQLTNDKCVTNFQLTVYNHDQNDRNEAERRKEDIMSDPEYFGCIPRKKLPNPTSMAACQLAEPAAITVLNALLKVHIDERQAKLNKLKTFFPIAGIQLTDNPIQQLYANNTTGEHRPSLE